MTESVVIHSRYKRPYCKGVSFLGEKSLTQQQFKGEADINVIMSKYAKTGYLIDPLLPRSSKPKFGDYASESDFHGAQMVIAKSKEQFEALPAELRDRFHNDPSRLLAFLGDEKNRAEAERLGLVSVDSGTHNEANPVPEPQIAQGGQVVSSSDEGV